VVGVAVSESTERQKVH